MLRLLFIVLLATFSIDSGDGHAVINSPEEVGPFALVKQGDGVAPKHEAFTSAEMTRFKSEVSKVVQVVMADMAQDLGEGAGEDLMTLIAQGDLAEDNGLVAKLATKAQEVAKAKSGFGSIIAMGLPIVMKFLKPKLQPILSKLPAWLRPPILQSIEKCLPLLIKGDINGAKNTLINLFKKAAIKKVMEKLKGVPADIKSMLENVLDKAIAIPPNIKAIIKALKEGVVSYGVKKADAIISMVCAGLPAPLKTPVKTAAVSLVKRLSSLIINMEEQRRLGDASEEEMDNALIKKFAPMLIEKGVQIIGGVVKPGIKQMTDKLPSMLEAAKEPLRTTLVGMFDDIVKELADQSNWSSPDSMKKKIVQALVSRVKKLGSQLQSVGMDAIQSQIKKVTGSSSSQQVEKLGESEKSALATHFGHVARQLSAPLAHVQGINLGHRIAEGLTKLGKDEAADRFNPTHLSLGKKSGKAQKRKRGKGVYVPRKHGELRDGLQAGYGGKSKGKGGGGLFGKIAGFAKKAAGAFGLSPGKIIEKTGVYNKIPADFRPLVKGVLSKLIAGDKKGAIAAAKKEGRELVAKKIGVFIKPLLDKLPASLQKDLRPMIETALPQIVRGDIKGAITTVKAGLIKFGLSKMKFLVGLITSKIPVPQLRMPAKTFLEGVIDKVSASVVKRREALGDAGQMDAHQATDEEVGSVVNMLLEKGVQFIGNAVPGLVDNLVEKLPSALAFAKLPLKAQLTGCIKEAVAVLGKGPSMWNKDGINAVIAIVIKRVKLLATALAASATGGGDDADTTLGGDDADATGGGDDADATGGGDDVDDLGGSSALKAPKKALHFTTARRLHKRRLRNARRRGLDVADLSAL